MSPNSILAAPERVVKVVDAAPAAWRIVAIAGAMLTLVAIVDIALVFYPWRLGEPGWEFGVATAALSSLPLLVVGFAAWLGASVARQNRTTARILAAAALVTGLVILAGYVLYLTNVPVALRVATDQVAIGIRKSVVRTSFMALVFGSGFIVSGITAFRAHRQA